MTVIRRNENHANDYNLYDHLFYEYRMETYYYLICFLYSRVVTSLYNPVIRIYVTFPPDLNTQRKKNRGQGKVLVSLKLI